jgi:crotonobetainyl-CoA:carnitine CoA-transferase CaiB-like acyl-CoA transferase
MPGPLSGVRVLDLTTVLLGPYASMLLADMGADVIKIEAPEGDVMRLAGPRRHPGMGPVYLNGNRNKRAIALDLKQDAGRDVLRRLIAGADVFVHNMRPKAIERLGFGYEAVRAVREDIVYCGAYGFAADGPYADRPAYDDLIQAMSGLVALFERTTGEPRLVPTVVCDKLIGLTVSQAVAMALYHRERTGEGQAVEVPMFETMVSWMMVEGLYGHVFEPPLGGYGYARLMTPHRKPYPTKDGYMCVLPYTNRQWSRLFELVGMPEKMQEELFRDHTTRIDRIDEVYGFLADLLTTRTNAEWMAICAEANIPATPVLAMEDLADDPHLQAVGMFQTYEHPTEGRLRTTKVPIRFSATPGELRRGAPRFGEHNAEILREAGYAEAEIDALRRDGVLLSGEAE